ncbi:MAG: hypothetical protein BWY47_00581 [Bacteroidetes bacterium ADurb.Bin302]|nr:MAG: hypothetical protein BWY47_00581 [Bacteroidetes bacterium ADurb.Bin302]
MADTTTFEDVLNSFHTHLQEKQPLPTGLENAFFESALAYYELEIDHLDYNEDESKFDSKHNRTVVYTLGMIMYTEYLTRELSRIEKLQGFHGKDIQLTGSDESKRTTKSDLELELQRCNEYLHKQKRHGYN